MGTSATHAIDDARTRCEDKDAVFLHHGDLTDTSNLIRLVQSIRPDEVYNLAAQSHVNISFETPEYTANADALGTVRLLEALRILDVRSTCASNVVIVPASPPVSSRAMTQPQQSSG